MMVEAGKKVVVTTEFRGVFFGVLTAYDVNSRTCSLSQVRNCVYWPTSNKGFLGLAVTGPQDGARVGPAADAIDLVGVTSVTPATDAAAKAWEAAPWS